MNSLQSQFQREKNYDTNDIIIGDFNPEYIEWLENKINNISLMDSYENRCYDGDKIEIEVDLNFSNLTKNKTFTTYFDSQKGVWRFKNNEPWPRNLDFDFSGINKFRKIE